MRKSIPLWLVKLQGRALYNLIRLNWQEDSSIPAEPWAIEDLRSVPEPQLFKRLKTFDINLDKKIFIEYSQTVDSPEELADTLFVSEEEDERFDQVYLIIFELWRRLLQERQTLSIFCDELDNLLSLYDRDQLENEEPLQNALDELEKLLDDGVDQGGDPQELFAEVSSYCAQDIESFIYDYAADLIESEEMLYASELIDGFSRYIENTKWFEFLRAALLFETDEEESMVMFERILETLSEDPDLDLLLEIARFLVKRGNPQLFMRVIKQARSLIATEQDFQELVALTCHFSRLLEREEVSKKLQHLLDGRQGNVLDDKIRPNDRAIDHYYELLTDF